MGIRIHKVMGWGLKDVKVKNYRIVDPRFKPLDPNTDENLHDKMEQAGLKILEMYKTEEDKKEFSKIVKLFNPKVSHNIYLFLQEVQKANHVFTHSVEGGNPKVMVFTPLGCLTWYRYDDTIDYYQDGGKGTAPKVLDLTNRCGIYPFIGVEHIGGTEAVSGTVNIEGKEASPTAETRDFFEPSTYNILVGKWDKKRKAVASGKTLEILLNNYRPVIPESIIIMTYLADIFVDWKATVNQLRPMLYTFWE
jgi:hypothetical protein